mmetsp:Transcript_149051/g.260478  ORF Transcript_149051/g.260478 Transcript_149051/m.260478 type:complete len:207 (-) Transcript_149051:19-639(-)
MHKRWQKWRHSCRRCDQTSPTGRNGTHWPQPQPHGWCSRWTVKRTGRPSRKRGKRRQTATCRRPARSVSSAGASMPSTSTSRTSTRRRCTSWKASSVVRRMWSCQQTRYRNCSALPELSSWQSPRLMAWHRPMATPRLTGAVPWLWNLAQLPLLRTPLKRTRLWRWTARATAKQTRIGTGSGQSTTLHQVAGVRSKLKIRTTLQLS